MKTIYIIIDRSYEADGYDYPSDKIRYVSTDREEAIAFFHKYYQTPPQSDKWHYEYVLLEYPDGHTFISESSPKELLSSSNC